MNNLSIENPNGKQIATFPFIQVIRLIYNKTHQIIIFPNELSIYNFNIKWENAKASIVKDTFEDRLIIEAENLMINDEKNFASRQKNSKYRFCMRNLSMQNLRLLLIFQE